jgi:hypothetical protein
MPWMMGIKTAVVGILEVFLPSLLEYGCVTARKCQHTDTFRSGAILVLMPYEWPAIALPFHSRLKCYSWLIQGLIQTNAPRPRACLTPADFAFGLEASFGMPRATVPQFAKADPGMG